MKKIILALIFFYPFLAFAEVDQCTELNTEAFIGGLVEISEEHKQMSIQDIHLDYQQGVSFILKTFGIDSLQYKNAMTFTDETSTMSHEDMEIVESLRIQIIPIMGPESIYKGHHKILMRNCRDVLLAAMILT